MINCKVLPESDRHDLDLRIDQIRIQFGYVGVHVLETVSHQDDHASFTTRLQHLILFKEFIFFCEEQYGFR